MKSYQQVRKIHLWVGLFMAILILIEAVSGLLLSEPGLLGESRTPAKNIESRGQINVQANYSQAKINSEERGRHYGQNETSLLGVVKKLHQGRVGSYSFKWIVDLLAVGLIVLTLTGIYLSLVILKAKNKKIK